jgi:VWFA-related protein
MKMYPQRHGRIALIVFLTILLMPLLLSAQATTPPPSTTQASTQNTPEITSHDETTTFKVKVNLVEVRVVVRDSKGKAVGNLKQEDFQLLDNGKPQVIAKFSVERAGQPPVIHHEDATATPEEKTAPTSTTQPPVIPNRYIAYLFDDIHLNFSDLAQARNAASKQFGSLQPADRAAIYTTSGQTRLDFTDDRAQLTATLNRILPRPIANQGTTPCPNISYYMADLIQNRNDPEALRVAMQDAIDCGAVSQAQDAITGAPMPGAGMGQMQAYVHRALDLGDQETRISLGVLQDVIRHIAAMPGQRIIVLVSPGFVNPESLPLQSELTDRALHSGVVISSLDARGLYTGMPDASEQRSPTAGIAGKVLQYHIMEQAADSDIMADLADATGGTFFHNNNDLEAGFRRLVEPPEYSYLLGFSPQSLKLDGKYHKLKVTLKSPAEGAVQARKGYYAPKGATDASAQARQAIEDAVFSQEEVREIPIELHTQFFKADENDAKLSVVAHLDVRHVHFRKADGRNNNDVTVVSAVFDRNGNFVSGNQKVLQMHLKDETLAGRLNSGITLKSSFDVKPGSYIVRLVVRDEDGQLATQSSVVEIP